MTCVYWEDKSKKKEKGQEDDGGKDDDKKMQWSVEGCWVAYSDENYTVCSCSHLSTFALIMQIGEVYQIYYVHGTRVLVEVRDKIEDLTEVRFDYAQTTWWWGL